MGIEQLFSPADVALLFDWLRESGELYLDLDRPHSGGSNNSVHFIGSLPALKSIISREEHPEISIHIFRREQYPIRGIVGQSLGAPLKTNNSQLIGSLS